MNESYMRLSEETNALDYLEKAVAFIKTAEANLIDWKWVILALNDALYGFMICALRGTTPDNVLLYNKKRVARLIDFGEALRRCQDPAYMTMTSESKVLVVTEPQKRSVTFVHETFRNSFQHYQPALWSIELHGMPEIAIDVLDVTRFVALETGNYIHLEEPERATLNRLVQEGKESLRASKLFRETHSDAP